VKPNVLDRLEQILRQAGQLLLDRRANGTFTFQRNTVSVSASVDIEAHKFLVQELSALDSAIPVLSEEDAAPRSAARPEVYWLIDPLDGTASFVDGYAGFVTQAALIRGCKPIISGVYAPALDEMFLAEEGSGTVFNGKRLRTKARLPLGWILTDNYPAARGIAADAMRELNIPCYLECGSIGLKICRVADGSADLFLKDVTVRDWDVAAPQLVLTEAGGVLSDISGLPYPYSGNFDRHGLLASASRDIAVELLQWLKRREKT